MYPIYASKLIVEYGNLVNVLGEPFKIFEKFVRVFDLFFVATSTSPDEKVLHGASVLYQYIDNDDNGIPDNEEVYKALVSQKATIIMFCDQDELEKNSSFFKKNKKCLDVLVQDLESDETLPGSLVPDKFDASLEECFHLVTAGYCIAYPDIFGLKPGTIAADCLDNARGGHFMKVPKKYPAGAWFTYKDCSCDYGCQITEYLYWAMTSILHGQKHRCKEIAHEWKLCTHALVENCDKAIFNLLTDEKYKFPTKLPVPLKCLPIYK